MIKKKGKLPIYLRMCKRCGKVFRAEHRALYCNDCNKQNQKVEISNKRLKEIQSPLSQQKLK